MNGYYIERKKCITFKQTAIYQLYTSFVFPYLLYCSEIWGAVFNINLQLLIKLQKKIIRIINVSPYNAPMKLIFQELTFSSLQILHLIESYSISEIGIVLISLQNLFCKKNVLHILTIP